MKEPLLSSFSNYGRYIPKPISNQDSSKNTISNLYSITLKQNYAHQRPFTRCKFDIQGTSKLYLIDSVGTLLQLSVNDQSYSTLKNQNITNFQIDHNNCYNLVVSTKKHELHKVNFESKKTTKITNLQITKLLSFEKDYLRDILLVLDYKVLFLHDLANPGRIKSIKAVQNQIFTAACLGPSNRFLILAIKGIEIRFIQIMSLKTIHSIKLPFTVNNLKMQVSIHQKKVAIYGNCPIIFFINYTGKQQLTYELIELPFVNQVKQLQFVFEESLLLLGSDQVIYGIPSVNQNPCKIIRLLNSSHVRVKAFDVSLDAKTMAVVSNRTVYVANWPNGVHHFMENSNQYHEIEMVKDGFKYKALQSQLKNQEQPQNKAYQYEDEESQEEEEEVKIDERENDVSLVVPNDLKFKSLFQPLRQQGIILPTQYEHLDESNDQVKKCVFQIINLLYKAIPGLQILYKQHQCLLIGLVYSFYKLSRKGKLQMAEKCFQISYIILNAILKCEHTKIQQYGLVFCPEIVSIIQKRFNRDFVQFFTKQLKKLCIDYFNCTNWIKLIQFILTQSQYRRSDSLILIFILSLKKIGERCGGDWSKLMEPTEFTKSVVNFEAIITQINHIENHQKYRSLFNTQAEQLSYSINNIKEENQILNNRITAERDLNLQQLMRKQQAIRIALINLRQRKPH